MAEKNTQFVPQFVVFVEIRSAMRKNHKTKRLGRPKDENEDDKPLQRVRTKQLLFKKKGIARCEYR